MSSRKAPAKSKKDAAADAAAEEKERKLREEFKYSSSEMSAMRTELRTIKAEIADQTKLLNDFQQQKAKIESFWEMSKGKRDELKLVLREKLHQKADLEEKQNYELKIYKQKVKNLLHEQQQKMSNLHIEQQQELHSLQTGQRSREHEWQSENRTVKQASKQQELSHYDLLKSIKQEQEKSIMSARQEYERRSEELKHHYEKKMKTVREEFDEKRKEDVARIELKKNTHIADLMAKHKRKFDKIKKYYSDITHANLELIKNLKEEVGDMKKKEAAVQKEVNDIRRINKKLSKPLHKNRKLVEDLKQDLLQYKKDKEQLGAVKENLHVLEEKMKNAEWEHEIAEQKYEHLLEEKQTLQDKLESTIYNVQQKSGFKNLLLEKKLEAMQQDLEKTESALAEVLASTNLHPEVIGDIRHNLEDVLMAKNKSVQRLEDQLEELKRRYVQTIELYERKLREYNIPVEELGFVPVPKL